MIERLQKLSVKLFQQSLKTYTIEDVVKHKKSQPINLVETCALYPNKGVGFDVWKLGWPKQMKIRVTQAMLKSNRHGKLRGVKRFGDKELKDSPVKFSGASKRGIWKYSVQSASSIELDNNLVYTVADFKAFQQFRATKQKIVEEQIDAAEEHEGNEEQEQNEEQENQQIKN